MPVFCAEEFPTMKPESGVIVASRNDVGGAAVCEGVYMSISLVSVSPSIATLVEVIIALGRIGSVAR